MTYSRWGNSWLRPADSSVTLSVISTDQYDCITSQLPELPFFSVRLHGNQRQIPPIRNRAASSTENHDTKAGSSQPRAGVCPFGKDSSPGAHPGRGATVPATIPPPQPQQQQDLCAAASGHRRDTSTTVRRSIIDVAPQQQVRPGNEEVLFHRSRRGQQAQQDLGL